MRKNVKNRMTVICFLFVFCNLLSSCKDPVSSPVFPEDIAKHENSYTVAYNANHGEGLMAPA